MTSGMEDQLLCASDFLAWLNLLEVSLQTRFGIGLGDVMDVENLHQDFNKGESPQQVTDYLKQKWDLVDL